MKKYQSALVCYHNEDNLCKLIELFQKNDFIVEERLINRPHPIIIILINIKKLTGEIIENNALILGNASYAAGYTQHHKVLDVGDLFENFDEICINKNIKLLNSFLR